MTDTTLNTRPTRWTWLGYPAESIPTLQLTGWPIALNGQTVTLTIGDDAPLSAVIVSQVATFSNVTLPTAAGNYVLLLTLGTEVFARGVLRIQDAGTSSFTTASFDVSTDALTFALTVTVLGGSGTVDSVVAGTNIVVDSTDPANPVVGMTVGAAANVALGGTAVQPADLATVATTGAYADLSGKPTLGTAAATAATAYATAAQGATADSAATSISDHIADPTAAHAATAILVNAIAGITGTDAQTVLAELKTLIDAVDDEVTALPVLTTTNSIRVDSSVANQLRPHRKITSIVGGTVASTAAATTLWAATPTVVIPANTITLASSIVKLSGSGVVLNNTGVDRTVTYRILVAGNAIMTFVATLPAAATARSYNWEVVVTTVNLGSAYWGVGGPTKFSVGAPGSTGANLINDEPWTTGFSIAPLDAAVNLTHTAQPSFSASTLTTTASLTSMEIIDPVVYV